MLPRDARQAQRGTAMRTFAEDVRFPIPYAQKDAAEGTKQSAEKTLDRSIFSLPFVDVAGEKTEYRVHEE